MKLKHIFLVSIICILVYGIPVKAFDYDIKYMDPKSNIAQNKGWTIKFNKELNVSTVIEENIQVLDSEEQIVPITLSLSSDNLSITLLPDLNYEKGKTYTLCIKKPVASKDGCEIPKEVRMEFTITNPDLVETVNKMDNIEAAVKTQPEKELVADVKSILIKKINDPSKEIDTSSLKSQYDNLSETEKLDLQTVFLSDFSLDTLSEIMALFE
ncbi:Ig-like domain-containing protein [Clostridium sp.]|uniref:Ig-like domain-containing protein n=1 Tax=Clostridium sp. TaxID=1506 RepID=UPI002FDE7D9D